MSAHSSSKAGRPRSSTMASAGRNATRQRAVVRLRHRPNSAASGISVEVGRCGRRSTYFLLVDGEILPRHRIGREAALEGRPSALRPTPTRVTRPHSSWSRKGSPSCPLRSRHSACRRATIGVPASSSTKHPERFRSSIGTISASARKEVLFLVIRDFADILTRGAAQRTRTSSKYGRSSALISRLLGVRYPR